MGALTEKGPLGGPYGKGPQVPKWTHKVYATIGNCLKKQQNVSQKGSVF